MRIFEKKNFRKKISKKFEKLEIFPVSGIVILRCGAFDPKDAHSPYKNFKTISKFQNNFKTKFQKNLRNWKFFQFQG